MKILFENDGLALMESNGIHQMAEKLHGSGVLNLQIMRGGDCVHDEVANNLITNSAIGSDAWPNLNGQIYSYADTTPNYDDLNGTYSQSGTTVTRISGSGVFAAGDVGKEIKFGTGERCHIITFGSATSVTVSKSQAVPATTLRRYFTTFNSVTGYVQTVVPSTSTATDIVAGVYTFTASFTMPSAPSAYSLGSISVGTTGARIVMATPVAINVGDQIVGTYVFQATLGSRADLTVPLSSVVAGWPYQYAVASIAGSGSVVTITTSENHNFAVGDLITVPTAIPQRKAVSSASSNSTIWTVVATSHGFSVGDSVVHEGFSISGYNSTVTVGSVIDVNTYAVTNASNPGASTGGTTRKATPGTYFSGDYTVATVPNSTTVTASSAITGPAVDGGATKVCGKDECSIRVFGQHFGQESSSFLVAAVAEANAITPPAVTQTFAPSGTALNGSINSGIANTKVQNASYSNDFASTNGVSDAGNWSAGGSSSSRIKQLAVSTWYTSGGPLQYHLLTLRTPQEKKTTHKLTYPKVSRRFVRDLP